MRLQHRCFGQQFLPKMRPAVFFLAPGRARRSSLIYFWYPSISRRQKGWLLRSDRYSIWGRIVRVPIGRFVPAKRCRGNKRCLVKKCEAFFCSQNQNIPGSAYNIELSKRDVFSPLAQRPIYPAYWPGGYWSRVRKSRYDRSADPLRNN